jgi:hypothetical protein
MDRTNITTSLVGHPHAPIESDLRGDKTERTLLIYLLKILCILIYVTATP